MTQRVTKLILLLLLVSCTTDKRLEDYKRIIDNCDEIKIYIVTNNLLTLTKEVKEKEELENLQDILKGNVKPEFQRKFKTDKRFEIIKEGKVVGQILINDSRKEPFANFSTDSLSFGFQLTYRIGMYFN